MTCRRNGVESVVSRQVYKGFLLPDRTEDVQAVIPILGLVEVVYSVEAVMVSSVAPPYCFSLLAPVLSKS
jgi:hypothetical protein